MTDSPAQGLAVEVRRHLGRPMIFMEGRPLPLTMYSPPGGSPSFVPFWENAMTRFLDQKLNVYLVNIPRTRSGTGVSTLENFWQGETITTEPMVQSHEAIDASPLLVRERCPEAHMMIRFSPRPDKQWMAAHPDEVVVREDGERMDVVSLASERGWDMMARYCAALIGYVESRPWAQRVIGYCNYHYHEGTHPPVSASWLYDHSPVMRDRWRAFLKRRYSTVDALREAYGDASLTFDSMQVPCDLLNGSRREVAALPYWQEAAQNQPLRDYLELVAELYHANLRKVGEASRHVAGAGKLLLHDTFKIPMQGWALMSFFGVGEARDAHWPIQYAEILAGSGNVGVNELVAHPGFDGLVTPHDYQVRGVGGVFEPEGLADSMVLRDKLFFVEWDARTGEGGERTRYGAPQDLKEYNAVMWRDLATAMTRGFHNYFCDHNGDYHPTPQMQQTIRRQAEVVEQSVDWPHETMPGIAMVLDDQAMRETSGSGHVLNEAVMWEQKMGVSRCGVPYRIYVLDDLELDNFPPHRVFYFPNLYRIDERRLAVLREKVFRDGNVVVFGPGSGISDGRAIGTDSATRLTGFEFELRPTNYQRRIQVIDYAHLITRDLPADAILASSVAYGPQLYPTSGRPLARAWSQRGEVDAGLAVQTFGRGPRSEVDDPAKLGAGDYAAVFSTTAPLSGDLWRGIARFAGAHVYNEENDVLLASKHLVAVHAVKPGPRTIALPGRQRVTDLIDDRLVAEDTGQIALEISPPATHFFHVTPMA